MDKWWCWLNGLKEGRTGLSFPAMLSKKSDSIWCSCTGLNRPEREADHLFPYTYTVKKEWSCSPPQYVYRLGFLTKHTKELNVNWSYMATYIVVSCPDFNARPVHVEFVADKAALGQTFLWIQQLYWHRNFNNVSESFIHLPAMLHNRSNWLH